MESRFSISKNHPPYKGTSPPPISDSIAIKIGGKDRKIDEIQRIAPGNGRLAFHFEYQSIAKNIRSKNERRFIRNCIREVGN